ncbi:MAG: triose-phosphate isomerase [Verrucomicrobia bacterium]|nr:triose-phosphate isomerase [Verrucomicrobiota bacterium]
MRKKILAANWKMNLTQDEADAYVHSLVRETGETNDVEVVLIPAFTVIPALAARLNDTAWIRLGAQNMHWEKSGAYTGEISGTMLRALYVRYVILGHSERRNLFGETNEIVNRKVKAALEQGLRPILCIGESLQERDLGHMNQVLEEQIRVGLKGVSLKEFHDLVIAYEPIWAIGTGKSANPQQAQEAHVLIRSVLAQVSDSGIAERVRIQYGGSVKPENAQELMSQKDIDGALVGAAGLDPVTFSQIIRCTEAALA